MASSSYFEFPAAEDIEVLDAALFSGILSASDIDVQTALNTLDAHTHDASTITLALNDLTDVNTAGLLNGMMLQYNASSGNWEVVTIASLNGQLDHGLLQGLGDDDHLQYLTEARHDGLPFDNPHNVTITQTIAADSGTDVTTAELEQLTDGSNADSLHTHAGLGIDEKVKVSGNDTTPGFLLGKIIGGLAIVISEVNNGGDEDLQITVDPSAINIEDLGNVVITGLVGDSFLQYNSIAGEWQNVTLAGVNTQLDHGQLLGLSDDDHLQYLTEARHDALPFDNPHNVTLTQAVTADAGTDVTAAELEQLTNGSNADSLHSHALPAHTHVEADIIDLMHTLAFRTINTPAGSPAVADNVADVLTLTASDSTMIITGSGGADSIDFRVDPSQIDLGDLGDVNLSGLSQSDILQYNNVAGEWQNVSLPGAWTTIQGNSGVANATSFGETLRIAGALNSGIDVAVTEATPDQASLTLDWDDLLTVSSTNPADLIALDTASGMRAITVSDLLDAFVTEDVKVKVTANDTNPGFLLDKIIAGSSKVTVTEINNGADEDLAIDIDPSQIDLGDLGDVDLTGLGSGDILAYNSVSGNWEPVANDEDDEYEDGGEARGKDRSLGNTDLFALDFITNNIPRIAISNAGNVRVGKFFSSPYALSVQRNAAFTYLEILNNRGGGRGSFFGMENNGATNADQHFALYNWDGGPITFYTDPNVAAGSRRFTIENDGDVRVHNLTTGIVRSDINGVLFNGTVSLGELSDVTLTAPADDSFLQFNSGTGQWEDVTLSSLNGQLDHGALAGLGDDDHLQYLTEARHDALPADNPHSVTFTQSVAADPGTDITASEAETLTDGSNADSLHSHDHGALSGLGDDDHPQYLNETRHDALPADNPHSVTFTQAVAADAGTDITASEAETLTDGSNADALHTHAGLGDGLAQKYIYHACDLDTPNNSDWEDSDGAPAIADPNNNALTVRAFDDSEEESVGTLLQIPSTATSVTFYYKHRAATAPGSAQTVLAGLHFREIPDNGAVTAWTAENDIASLNIPTNTNYQYDSQTVTLASLGMNAGSLYQWQFIRDANDGGDTLVGDWYLLELCLEFS